MQTVQIMRASALAPVKRTCVQILQLQQGHLPTYDSLAQDTCHPANPCQRREARRYLL